MSALQILTFIIDSLGVSFAENIEVIQSIKVIVFDLDISIYLKFNILR